MVSTLARHWRLRAAHASSGFDLTPDDSGPVLCTVYAQVEIAGKEDLVFGSRPLCPTGTLQTPCGLRSSRMIGSPVRVGVPAWMCAVLARLMP